MSKTTDSIIGLQEFTGCSAVPAVDMPVAAMVAAPQVLQKKADLSDKKKKKKTTVESILGEGNTEGEEKRSLVPDGAVEVEPEEDAEITGLDPKVGKEVEKEPSEPLIHPSAALVAPDATPDLTVPLDPSMVPPAPKAPEAKPVQPASAPVPVADPALAAILGNPQAAAESMLKVVPPAAMDAPVIIPGVTGEAVLAANQPMPEHKVGDVVKITEAFRRFSPV